MPLTILTDEQPPSAVWACEMPAVKVKASKRAKVESGEWRVESGEWRVESGEWRVESGIKFHDDKILVINIAM
jgi:hypothetical protein